MLIVNDVIIIIIFFIVNNDNYLQTGQNIGTARVQDRARAVRQRNGPQDLVPRRIVSGPGRPGQSRFAVPYGRCL